MTQVRVIRGGAADVQRALDTAPDFSGDGPPPDRDDAPPARKPRGKGGHTPVKTLPPDCPVMPLGVKGKSRFYLDALRQLVSLPASEHNRTNLMGLFGQHIHFLHNEFPRFNKRGDPDGWRPEQVAEALMTATSERGVWDPDDRVRAAGSWLGDDGELLVHYGDAIWRGPTPDGQTPARWFSPGLVGRHVYPAGSPLVRQSEQVAEGGEGGAADDLLTLLRSWSWRRDDLDAQLLLGWIGAAMLGGALKWRPLMWLTGGKGTGKSTLHDVLRAVFGDALVSVSDASAAGVWQKLGYATLPVAFDELEAEEDNRKANNVIKLARQAASGGVILRGGSDHQSSQFVARSCFLFSSILVPPLQGQDRSRMAILELDELQAGQKPPALDPKHFRALGAKLRRRLADGWTRWPATLDAYRTGLMEAGHSARGADQFGTLLAAADLLLWDTVPESENVRQWTERMQARDMAERDDDERDEQRCLSHLLSSVVDPYRNGKRTTVGEWICRAAGLETANRTDEDGTRQGDANAALGTSGMRVVEGAESRQKYLAVANYHQGLAAVFRETHWAGRSGTMGVWVQALRRLPGAQAGSKAVWFGGQVARATLIPMDSVIKAAPADRALELVEGL